MSHLTLFQKRADFFVLSEVFLTEFNARLHFMHFPHGDVVLKELTLVDGTKVSSLKMHYNARNTFRDNSALRLKIFKNLLRVYKTEN